MTKRKSNPKPQSKTNPASPASKPKEPTDAPFSIVGIGASAGGLEALEQFLENTPAECGMAFVIIQHLDPTYKGMMPQLLQRSTDMKVNQVTDRMRVQPNSVYVIPPNKDMSMLHGVLHLLEPATPHGLRLPIDSFFRSLALDLQERSIGVILSGMGSDGTLGLRAIKEKAGLALVQDPASAKFDSMPRSVIEAGLADIVAPVTEIPEKILAWLQRPTLPVNRQQKLEEKAQSVLEKAILLLREHSGNDFSHYKHNTLYRRIERRMGIHQIDKIDDYIRYLQENEQELDLLFKELLIGVTNFFRDPTSWTDLSKSVIPALLSDRPAGQAIRAWVPGCSSGEEAYSLAILIKESVEEFKPSGSLQIQVFATDLDEEAIEKARYGLFTSNIAADVSPERLARFFSKEEGGYRVRKEIRETVIFATQNLIMDPPFTRLDILSCRNLLIYLAPEVQKKIIPLFHYSLNPGGILFLGSAETIGDFTNLFAPLAGKPSLYRNKESTIEYEALEFPTSFNKPITGNQSSTKGLKKEQSLQALADQMVLQRYAPPATLVNDKGDILYISGRTGKYLEPAAGKANWNIFAMAREGLRNELFSAFQKALRLKEKVTFRSLKTEKDKSDPQVEITIEQLETPEPLQGLIMVLFTDLPVSPKRIEESGAALSSDNVTHLADLQRELKETREEAEITRKAMQTSQEELRSANEELQSTNEELQSTNEELMTSKEEMQSLNEELQTVNSELQAKVEELSRANNDMDNLLNSTEIATVFLDNQLMVRRFTEQAKKLIRLIPSDIGRPITDLASQLCYPDLAEDASDVLRKLMATEKAIKTLDGGRFKVRIMPYRTLDNKIDGVVITFSDITAARNTSEEKKLPKNDDG